MLKNFSYLSFHQLLRMLVPILLIPYYLKIVGTEKWGSLVYVQYIYHFFVMIIGYGFSIYSVKLVAENRNKKKELDEIVSAILIIKSTLFLVSIILISFLVACFSKFGDLKIVFLLYIGILIFEVINPIWFFQGLEKMKIIPVITIIENSITLVAVFLLIKNSEDYLYIPLIHSLSLIISGLFSIFYVFRYYKISFTIASFDKLSHYFREGFEFFLSRLCATINDKSTVILIGSFLPYHYVSFFDLALKIINGLTKPFAILSEVIYPKMSKSKDLKQANKFLSFSLFASLSVYVALIMIGTKLMVFIGGDQFVDFEFIFLMLGIIIPCNSVSSILGTSFLVSFGFQRAFNRSVIFGTFAYLLLLLVVISNVQMGEMIFAMLTFFSPLVVLLIRVVYCMKFRLLPRFFFYQTRKR